jgi:hypothetical protein
MIKKIGKWIGLILLIAVVAIIVVGVVGYFYHPNDPPSVQEAPWAAQTRSRTYYAKDLSSYQGIPAISNYWYSDGGKWKFVSDKVKPPGGMETPTDKYIAGKWCLVFAKKIYGNVPIIRRTK